MAATKTFSRRRIMAAMGALPIAALAAPALAQAPSIDTAAWDQALAAFREVESVHTALWDRWEEASDAVDAHTPDRIDRYFDDYRLGIGMNRENVEYWLRSYASRTGDQIDIAATANAFDAYQGQIIAMRARFQTDQHYDAAKAYNPAFFAARNAVMEVPAPNVAALLVKIEIAAVSLDDDHAESVLADARRLLSGRA